MFGTRKLGKTSTQRKAMMRQQVTDLLENGKMETTFYRAKEVQYGGTSFFKFGIYTINIIPSVLDSRNSEKNKSQGR